MLWRSFRRRIALYSHDTQGLGHVQRNMAIAGALVDADPATDVLLITGAHEAASLPRPASTDLLCLPAVDKDVNGSYAPANLGLPLSGLLTLRSDLIAAAVQAFAPHLLIVDKEARGLHGELDQALRRIRSAGPRGRSQTRVVLGLRDVLDDPVRARREWLRARNTDIVRDYYDAVWVYGDPSVYDLCDRYGLPDVVRRKVQFTGYLTDGRGEHLVAHPASVSASPPETPYVLCVVGGGQDGSDLARAFVSAALPSGHQGVLVTGPYMPAPVREEVASAAAGRTDLTVHQFVGSTLDLIHGASAVVSMGGYNTLCEVLGSDTPCLAVPRVHPRREQAVRVEALAARAQVDVVDAAELHPDRISRWLAAATHQVVDRHGIDLAGLTRIPAMADALVGENDRQIATEELSHVAI